MKILGKIFLNTFHSAEWGPRSSGLCSQQLYFCCLGKTQPNWNRFQNELPSNEGRELHQFLLCCFDVQISKNTMASQEMLVSEALGIYFPWNMIASIKLMTRTMDGWLIMNKLRRRRVKLCQRVMATLQCKLSKCEHFDRFVFLPHPSFAPLSPNITWAREATHSELRGTKRLTSRTSYFVQRTSLVIVWAAYVVGVHVYFWSHSLHMLWVPELPYVSYTKESLFIIVYCEWCSSSSLDSVTVEAVFIFNNIKTVFKNCIQLNNTFKKFHKYKKFKQQLNEVWVISH